MDKAQRFVVVDAELPARLDVYLTGRLAASGAPTRSAVKALIEAGRVLVNGAAVKAGFALRAGDSVAVELPGAVEPGVEPEEIALDVLFEDDQIIVVNKQAGLAVHPGAGRRTGTLVAALLKRAGKLASTGGPLRPGIVHRLDMDTTGVIVAAKTDAAYLSLASQFKAHAAGRRYHALVWGAVKNEEGLIDAPIGRDTTHRKKFSTTRTRTTRTAVTRYRVIKRYPGMTYLELTPETGRTHQLRVHLAAINHPIVGDQLYGRRQISHVVPKAAADRLRGVKRQLLHAAYLGITHPATGLYMEFTGGLPDDMAAVIAALDAASGAEPSR